MLLPCNKSCMGLTGQRFVGFKTRNGFKSRLKYHCFLKWLQRYSSVLLYFNLKLVFSGNTSAPRSSKQTVFTDEGEVLTFPSLPIWIWKNLQIFYALAYLTGGIGAKLCDTCWSAKNTRKQEAADGGGWSWWKKFAVCRLFRLVMCTEVRQ